MPSITGGRQQLVREGAFLLLEGALTTRLAGSSCVGSTFLLGGCIGSVVTCCGRSRATSVDA